MPVNFTKGEKKIIEGFKNKVFPLYYDSRYHEERMKYEEKEEEQKNKIKNHLIQKKLFNG